MARSNSKPQETQVQNSNDTPEVTPQETPVVTENEQSEVQPVAKPKASHKDGNIQKLPHGATIETF